MNISIFWFKRELSFLSWIKGQKLLGFVLFYCFVLFFFFDSWYIFLSLCDSLSLFLMVKIPQSFFGQIIFTLFSTSWLHQISSVPSSFGEINKHILPFSLYQGFPCDSAGKESACNAGVLGLIPGLGRSPGEGKGYPLQYSGLENSMDCIVHGIAKSRTWLSDFHFHFLSPFSTLISRWTRNLTCINLKYFTG